uniref:EB domain-containing protein n=1 Tax=Parastrongyloides trichosuri TaxID=131310 RepID=A0A0N4ZCS9_PARTI
MQIENGQFDPYYYLNANDNDRLLFDRCGRLALVRKQQNNDEKNFLDEFNTLSQAKTHAYCGWCKYDIAKRQPDYYTNVNAIINPAIKTETSEIPITRDNQKSNIQQSYINNKNTYYSGSNSYTNTQRDFDNKNKIMIKNQNNEMLPKNTNNNINNIDNRKYYQKVDVPQRSDNKNYKNSVTIKPLEINYISNKKIDKTFENNKNINGPTINNPSKVYPDVVSLYPDGADAISGEDYEYIDIADIVTTPEPTRTQIPPTQAPVQLWPTYNSGQFDYQMNMPCAGFTDEICFQQKANMPTSKIHRCCNERILLTDLCVPGKCSNVTVQLCCIQKFLQSKHKCCNDEDQSRTPSPTDSFNRCCFENFIGGDDDCCPSSQAEVQWRDIYDLCFPNVDFDLSNFNNKFILKMAEINEHTAISFEIPPTPAAFDKTEEAQKEAKFMNQKVSSFLEGQIESTIQEYKVLANMNDVTTQRYDDMKHVAKSVTDKYADLNQKCEQLHTFLHQIDLIDKSSKDLEAVVHNLDEYVKQLELKFASMLKK